MERDYIRTQPKCVHRSNFHSNRTILTDNLYEDFQAILRAFQAALTKYVSERQYVEKKMLWRKMKNRLHAQFILHVSLKRFDIKTQNVMNIPLYSITRLIFLHMVHGTGVLIRT